MRKCIFLKRAKRLSTLRMLAIGLLVAHGLRGVVEPRLSGWGFHTAGFRNPRSATRCTSRVCYRVTANGHGSGWPTKFLAVRQHISRSIANSLLLLSRPMDRYCISFLAGPFRMTMLWSLRAQWPQWIQPPLLDLFATCRATLW